MLGAREHERREAELSNPAEALALAGREPRHHDPLVVAFERNQAVYGVPQDHRGREP